MIIDIQDRQICALNKPSTIDIQIDSWIDNRYSGYIIVRYISDMQDRQKCALNKPRRDSQIYIVMCRESERHAERERCAQRNRD